MVSQFRYFQIGKFKAKKKEKENFRRKGYFQILLL